MSEDPAAEFLQQEGEQLRDLGIEDATFAAPPPAAAAAPVAVDPFEDPFAAPAPAAEVPLEIPAETPPPAEAPVDLLPVETPMEAEPEATPEPVVTNDVDLINEFEAEVEIPPQDPMINGFTDISAAAEPAPVVPAPVPIQIIPTEEPESLVSWRGEKAALLQQQEMDEQDASVAWGEKAKKEMEDWYNRYNEQLEKVKNENRAAESQFIEEMTDTKPGNEWEKVARFCDFNPKFSKNTKDVSRMRSLLLQLKQSPLVR